MKKKGLFLDRDGVINIDKDYVYRIEDFEFIDGIFDVVRFFCEREYLPIVITNQAGIGRGYYTEQDFAILTNWMCKQFSLNGIEVANVYYCPFHPEHGVGQYKKQSYNRKPSPGMIMEAVKDFDINLNIAVLIGDKSSDIMAGKNAGVGTNILISNRTDIPVVPDFAFRSIKELVPRLPEVYKQIEQNFFKFESFHPKN